MLYRNITDALRREFAGTNSLPNLSSTKKHTSPKYHNNNSAVASKISIPRRSSMLKHHCKTLGYVSIRLVSISECQLA